ncbi:ABC transporter permease [Lutispora thermophila]|uniref:Simple sugar transport system permease protein n=1 Tax=Lutispora thermophila DSM 19022 TaxID=1122184 RepID=A0A1M6H8U6_9FIRM|nr:ABC transporter permease [Lutispora thermophila]SHJ18606.1 simple sugar transport system permease protein [Lutispora thermophila DSM 19022]
MESRMDEIKSTLRNTIKEILYPLTAIIVSFIVGGILVYAFGNNPFAAYKALFLGALGDLNKLGETLVTTTTLILTGLSVAFAYRCGLFNIGAEGQYIMGSVAAVWVGWAFQGLPSILHVTITLLAGALAGGIWAGIVGWLKAKVGSHEVINSIMMNYIAMNLSNYLIMTALNEPGKAFSYEVAPTAKLWRFAESFEQFKYSRLHIGIIIAIIIAFIAYYLLNKTITGYEIRAVGFNPSASEYGGINVKRNIVLAMVISGLFSGLAGGIQTAGVQYRVNNLFGLTGYGFDGISVALVANNNPIGVLLSAFLFGVLQKGGPMMQIEGIPKEVVGIIQGIILLFVASNFVRITVQRYKENKEIKSYMKKEEVK